MWYRTLDFGGGWLSANYMWWYQDLNEPYSYERFEIDLLFNRLEESARGLAGDLIDYAEILGVMLGQGQSQ